MIQYQQSFHPYYNPGVYDELKRSRRRVRKPDDSRQVKDKKCNISSPVVRKHPEKTCVNANIGKYILSDVNPATCLCKALDVNSRIEYTCRVVEPSKYQQVASLYFLPFQNEGINTVKEVILKEEASYIVFERSFSDLHAYVRTKRRLSEEEACHLFRQIVSIVAECHQSGVVLRDLKLRKFVFKDKEQKQLKLESLDGAAVLADKKCDTLYDKHGCPAYVSPEILEYANVGYSGKLADMWSLGVILYTMLLGRYPFHDQDPALLFCKIKSGQFVVPDTVSSKARCLLHSLLRRDPCDRLTAVEVLEHPWFSSNFNYTCELSVPEVLDQVVPDADFCSAKAMLFF